VRAQLALKPTDQASPSHRVRNTETAYLQEAVGSSDRATGPICPGQRRANREDIGTHDRPQQGRQRRISRGDDRHVGHHGPQLVGRSAVEQCDVDPHPGTDVGHGQHVSDG
jgi:hypothetical protein